MPNTKISQLPPATAVSGSNDFLEIAHFLGGTSYVSQKVTLAQIGLAAGGTSGQIQFNNGGLFGGFTVGGDATLNTGSGALTIAANAVSGAKFRQSAGLSVVGNSTSAAANVADIAGAANQVLVVNSGGTSLGFGQVNLASASAITGTLPAGNVGAAGSSGQLEYNNGGLLGGTTGWTYASSVLTNLQSIGSTSTDGLVLQNTAAAAAGAQQFSPRLHFTGQGWKTNATAASQTVDWIAELQPVQGNANPSANLVFSSQINGGGYNSQLAISSGGQLLAATQANSSPTYSFGSTNNTGMTFASGTLNFVVNGVQIMALAQGGGTVFLSNNGSISWGGGTNLFSPAVNVFQLGNFDAAAPVAQTLQVQNVAAGTSNTAGATTTIAGSKSTGNASGGSLLFQISPKGSSSGTSQNALATILSLGALGSPASDFSIGFEGAGGVNSNLWFTNNVFGAAPAGQWTINMGGSGLGFFTGAGLYLTQQLGFAAGVSNNPDAILTRAGAAQLQLGAADAAAPVAQTLQVQSVVAGTSNTAGVDWTFNASKGTGNAAGGRFVWQVSPAGSGGTAQNALTTGMILNTASQLLLPNTSAQNIFCIGSTVNNVGISWTSGDMNLIIGSAGIFRAMNNGSLTNGVMTGNGLAIGWGNQVAAFNSISWNALMTNPAAATVQHGDLDAAAPVAQTIQVQNVAGTSNTAGANWTFSGSRGTGTGAGGDIIFKTAPAGSSGTSQNPLVEALHIFNGANGVRLGGTDIAAPIAQSISVQSVLAGTSNTAGADWTFVASKSTGNANGGRFIWQTSAPGGSGTSQNAASNAMLLTPSINGTTLSLTDPSTGIFTVLESASNTGMGPAASWLTFAGNSATPGVIVPTNVAFGFSPTNAQVSPLTALDTVLTRKGVANLQFGNFDAAAPVAQTLSVQSVVAGTSNTAGANWTLNGSQGTGTGAGGDIIFKTAPAGSSGTSQNSLVEALHIFNGANGVRLGGTDIAAPIAQSVSVQNVIAGTSNTAGVNWTLNGSQGTGTGAGGDIVFKTAPAGSSGTSQNALAETFRIQKNGSITLTGTVAPVISGTPGAGAGLISFGSNYVAFGGNNIYTAAVGENITPLGLIMAASRPIGWSSAPASGNPPTTADTMLSRAAAATIQLGNADAATPVAQTLQVQNVVAGTSNTAGAAWTFNASQGTGTGAGGDIIFKTAPAGASGTSQNALVEALHIFNGANGVRFGGTDTAAPIAQTFSVQSVAAGTTNTNGATTTFVGSKSTGNGSGGGFNWQLTAPGPSGSTQNTPYNALQLAQTSSVFSTLTLTDGVSGQVFLISAANNGGIGSAGLASLTFAENIATPSLIIAGNRPLSWTSANVTGAPNSTYDTSIVRKAAANIQFGLQDAAAPVAQTLSVQSVIAGTSNTAGANWTFAGSRGTGTGAGGNIVFQTAPAGASGTSQNALATAFTITAPAASMQPSAVVGNQALATTATDGFLYIPSCAGPPTGTPTGFTGRVPMVYDSTNNNFYIFNGTWKKTTTFA